MLDDGHGGMFGGIEFADQLEGGVGIVDIVVRERFALHLAGGGDAGTIIAILVEGRPLMGIFAIAHDFAQRSGKAAIGDVAKVDLAGEPIGDGAVIGGGAGIGLGRKLLAQFEGNAARFDGFKDGRIIGGIDHDGYKSVILGGRAHHGGAADIDIFDDLVIAGAGGDGIFEGIEIDGDQIDGADRVCVHGGNMFGIVADGEQASMYLGMKRLDAAIHHFGKAGKLGNFLHRQPVLPDQLVGATGRDQVHPGSGQPCGEIHHARFVENRKQCPPDLYCLAHGLCLAVN